MQKIRATDVEDWITARLAEYVNIEPEAISRDARFESFGIDSAKAITLMVDLEDWLQISDELPLELLFEAESLRDAARHIVAKVEVLRHGESISGFG